MHFYSPKLVRSFVAVSANDARAANDNSFGTISSDMLDADGNPPALKLPPLLCKIRRTCEEYGDV